MSIYFLIQIIDDADISETFRLENYWRNGSKSEELLEQVSL